MQTVVLISCVSKKLPYKAKAKDIYISTLFKSNLQYAKTFRPDKIFILSAKHGLLRLDTEIEPYNETLNTKSSKEIKEWAAHILTDLKTEADILTDKMIFLAGNNYRKYLIPYIKNYEVPMEGLPIGKQLQYLKARI